MSILSVVLGTERANGLFVNIQNCSSMHNHKVITLLLVV